MPKMKKDRHGTPRPIWNKPDDHTDDRATYKAVPERVENYNTWNGLDLEEVTDEQTQEH